MERAGNSIYIVGGGPSLKGFNFNCLNGRRVMAINASLEDVPNPEFFLTADTWYCGVAVRADFWKKKCYKIMVIRRDHRKYHRAEPFLSFYDEIVIPNRFDGYIGFEKPAFATGGNSGFCGMQYAVLLGMTKIHLLGFDFSTEGGDHYHNRYVVGRRRLGEFARNFVLAVKMIEKKTNIEIISYSPISILNEHVKYRELSTL